MDPRPSLGIRGEDAARRHLVALGWRILAERHRTAAGEIDLIAEEGATVVFVEVKTRRSGACGPPEESVSPAKQRRIARAASIFLAVRDLHDRDCRFDVIAVDATGGFPSVRHLRDAFRA